MNQGKEHSDILLEAMTRDTTGLFRSSPAVICSDSENPDTHIHWSLPLTCTPLSLRLTRLIPLAVSATARTYSFRVVARTILNHSRYACVVRTCHDNLICYHRISLADHPTRRHSSRSCLGHRPPKQVSERNVGRNVTLK